MAQARILTSTEVDLLLDHISIRQHAERDRLMFLLTYLAGLKVSEIASLKVSDVLSSEGTIKNNIQVQSAIDTDERIVAISNKLSSEIVKYLTFIYETDCLIGITYSDSINLPLFYTQKREGFTPNTLSNHFHHLYQEAGLYGGSAMSGRRTFIANLSRKGVDVRVLSSLAGHKSLGTISRYLVATPDQQSPQSAVELL